MKAAPRPGLGLADHDDALLAFPDWIVTEVYGGGGARADDGTIVDHDGAPGSKRWESERARPTSTVATPCRENERTFGPGDPGGTRNRQGFVGADIAGAVRAAHSAAAERGRA